MSAANPERHVAVCCVPADLPIARTVVRSLRRHARRHRQGVLDGQDLQFESLAVDDAPTRAGLARSLAGLVVVCSPDAATSGVLDQLVRDFVVARGRDRLLALVARGEPGAAAGDPQACFPAALRIDERDGTAWEPIAADARAGRDGRELAVLKIFAGIAGQPLDRIRNREAIRQRRARRVALVTLLGFLVAAAGMAVWARTSERDARRNARAAASARASAEREAHAERAERERVEDLLRFMVTDLKTKLASIDRLDTLAGVADKAATYYKAIDVDLRSPEDRRRLAADLEPLIALLRAQEDTSQVPAIESIRAHLLDESRSPE